MKIYRLKTFYGDRWLQRWEHYFNRFPSFESCLFIFSNIDLLVEDHTNYHSWENWATVSCIQKYTLRRFGKCRAKVVGKQMKESKRKTKKNLHFVQRLQSKDVPFTQLQCAQNLQSWDRVVLDEFLTFRHADLIPSTSQFLSTHYFCMLSISLPAPRFLLCFCSNSSSLFGGAFGIFPQGHHWSLQPSSKPPSPSNLPAVKLILSLIRCN